MKVFFLSTFIGLISLAFLGCEVSIGPRVPGVVIAPAPPPPPEVVISTRPSLVFLSDYGIYVAPDVHYHIFFDGSFWFYYSDNHWYRGKNYNGPWVEVERNVPPGLMRTPPGQLKKMAVKMKKHGNSGEGKNKKKDRRRFQ